MTMPFLHVLFQAPTPQGEAGRLTPISDYKFQALLYEPDFDNKQPFSKYICKKALWARGSMPEIKLKMTIELGSSDSLLKFQGDSQSWILHVALHGKDLKGLVKA